MDRNKIGNRVKMEDVFVCIIYKMSFKSFPGQTCDSFSTNLSQTYEEQMLEEAINKIISNNVRPKAMTLQVRLKNQLARKGSI